MATFLASPLEILRSVVAGAFVTLTVLAGLFALSFVNPRLYESRAKAAVDSKALVARTPLPFGKVDPFRYDPNDCLILAMLSVGVEPVSPKSPQVEVPTAWRAQNFHEQQFESRKVSEQRGTLRHETCYGLKSVLLHADVKVAPYHRYIHGFTMVAGTLMTVLSFEAATKIIHGIALLLPLIIIVIGLKRGGKRGLSYAGMASAYLLFSGVWCFGWTLALGPAEILLCSLMLIGILRPERGSWFYSFAGASAAALDFLTGLSPSALILVIGMAIIDGHRPRIVLFISAVIAAFAAKALAVQSSTDLMN